MTYSQPKTRAYNPLATERKIGTARQTRPTSSDCPGDLIDVLTLVDPKERRMFIEFDCKAHHSFPTLTRGFV